MFGIGGQELIAIALLALVLLGPERIPAFARGVARAYREFTKVRRQVDNTLSDLRGELDLDADLNGRTDKSPAARRVPLDQLHTVEPTNAGGTPAPPLPVPKEDDYLAS